MDRNSQQRARSEGGEILRWAGHVVSAEELRRNLNGHRELLVSARAVITPLAAEHLRAGGIRITRESPEARPTAAAQWGTTQERPYPCVTSAIQAVEREGIAFASLPARASTAPCMWARAVAECVRKGECQGAVLFCDDAGLVCCIANKVPGLRAVAVAGMVEANRATAALGANLIAVAPAGRTFFELRQILRTVCRAGVQACPVEVSRTLQELDGHAHR
jgi:ribose 5-phosphate isomerase RpiB